MILVTLARVKGSSYRQPGARLMICRDGSYEGGISAGCLEADLLRKAAWLTRDGAVMERYSTLFDEPADIPFGLGCGGVLDVLLESVDTPECRVLMKAFEDTLGGQEHMVVTWLPRDGQPLRRAIFSAAGELVFASENLSGELLAHARLECLDAAVTDIEGIFVERLAPPQRLFVFGAGDDAKPLVTMACLLGWSVTVIDGRTHLARRSRFPESCVQVTSDASAILRSVGTRDAVVIMSHSYEQDGEYLAAILPLEPRYLGLLGSRQRSSLLIADAAEKLGMTVSACCERVSAPIGLHLGGDGPETIALAILAEVQARCTGSGVVSHKLSAEQVQHHLAASDVSSYAQAQCGLDIA